MQKNKILNSYFRLESFFVLKQCSFHTTAISPYGDLFLIEFATVLCVCLLYKPCDNKEKKFS